MDGPTDEQIVETDSILTPRRTPRWRSGTGLVSLLAWGVLALLMGIRFLDSLTYLEFFALFLPVLGLIAALCGLWIALIVRSWRQRRFPLEPIAMLLAFVLMCVNPAHDVIHKAGFQLAKPRLEAALVSGDCPTWAGAYRIERCSTMEGYRWFVLANACFLDICGLVKPIDPTTFKPDGLSPEGDGWYFVVERF